VRRFVIQSTPERRISGQVVLSRDGSRLVFQARVGQSDSLYVQTLDQFTPRALEGTEGAQEPFFSPDGEWIGFAADGKLRKIRVDGGESVTLCNAQDVIDATWRSDGSIIFGSINVGLLQVSAEGGEPIPLLERSAERGELDFHYLHSIPGGEALLITRHDKSGAFGLEVLTLATGERKRLLENAFSGVLTRTGHLVFGRGNSVFAAPFDLRRFEVSGPSVLVVENVTARPKDGFISFNIAEDGTLVYVPRLSLEGRTLVWVDRTGREEGLGLAPRAFSTPRLSPDGTQLAVSIETSDGKDIWVYDLSRGTEHRVTLEGFNEAPVWTPDGTRLTFASGAGEARNLFWKPADGTGVAERLTESDLYQWPYDWSPDGKALAYMETDPSDYWSLGILRPDGDPRVEPFARASGTQNKPRFSPDGRWIAYNWNQNIFIQPFPSGGGPRQISTQGGVEPLWAPSGREIFYSLPKATRTMMTVSLEAGDTVRSGRPQKLFEEKRYVGSFYGANHDLARDGRFLMVKPSEEELEPLRIQLVQGWFEELKRRVPTTDRAR
jgi:serine/threonine-protein kinase